MAPEELATLRETLRALVREVVAAELEAFAQRHALGPQQLYTRKQAANLLGMSLATIGVLIRTGQMKVRRLGSRTLVPHDELVRLAKRDLPSLWPPKIGGKTTRKVA